MIRTILISGLLTRERLDRVFGEFRCASADTSATDNLVLIVNSEGGNSIATLSFIQSVLGDERMRSLVERAEVKIYQAKSVATLLAFSFGATREVSTEGKIGFDFGERIVQVGNPDHYEQDGRLTPQFMERWQAYRDAVWELMRRLNLDADPDLNMRFCAAESRLELTADECLRRRIVDRIF